MKKTLKLVMAAMFCALSCVATMVIRIPSPMNGYVNLGDCFVLLGGWFLGPYYGFLAGGVGSALADFILGYGHYVPGTFVIKGLMGLAAALLFKKFGGGTKSLVISGFIAEVIMVLGYFGFASLLLGKGLGAARSIPGNIFQGAVGLIAGTLLYLFAKRAKLIDVFEKNTK